MKRKQYAKVMVIALAFVCAGINLKALPEYMRIYAADPYAIAAMRNQCATCHLSAAGGGEQNAFGKAFATAGFKITDELRKQFPATFNLPSSTQALPVSFVAGSDSQAVVEMNGKRYLIDTKTQRVTELSAASTTAPPPVTVAAKARTAPENPDVYQPGDVRLISLPTAKPIEKGSLTGDFTHRFPFGEYEVTDLGGLLGLDGYAVPSFGFTYGLTDRIHVGAYRSPHIVGAPILVYAGASLLDENKGHPVTAMARVGLEGRGNFQRRFTTSLELTLARSVTRHAQLYFVPTLSFNNRPFGPSEFNLPRANTMALGMGGALHIRPTVALLAEANW